MRANILVPFDFSDASERALAWAAALQRSIGGSTLRVWHALNPVPPGAALAGAATPIAVASFSDEDIAQVERAMKDAMAKHGADGAIEVVVTGAVGDAILTAARQRGANLIVMGTHGRGGIKRAVLGSVADFIVRHAECPVVTMRAATAASAKPEPS
jgi:nucleotide-binding universal stress UspA family protein